MVMLRRALELCRLQQFEGVRPNAITLASLLFACADLPSLKLGKCLQGCVMRQLESDVNMETELIGRFPASKEYPLLPNKIAVSF
ncbi:unnamed protein product [Ilex paraguariensis]|uniref:Uncharacterized protein n=1 Tax=Ilex paraguariensis TaxID=185542 RepID=A0ABC8UCM0_9AQUA